jgi:TolB protein
MAAAVNLGRRSSVARCLPPSAVRSVAAVALLALALVVSVTSGGCGVEASASADVVHAQSAQSASLPLVARAVAAGGWIVWADARNDRRPADGIERTDIYGLELASWGEVAICTGRGAQSQPAVSCDWVVWVDVPRPRKVTGRTRLLPHARIVALNLRSGERRLVCDARGWRCSPAISGSWIVWADSRNAAHPAARGAQTDLYAYNLATGVERRVCTAHGSQVEPAISGDWIVWRDTRKLRPGSPLYPRGDIYALGLGGSGERRLTPHTGACWSPAVCDGRAVWKGDGIEKGEGIEIRVLDLATGAASTIGNVGAGYFDPQISPRWVVVQTEGDPGAICAIDLAAGDSQQDVPHGSPVRPMGMALSGDLLVWSGGGDIAAYDLARGVRYVVCAARGYQSEPAVSVQ